MNRQISLQKNDWSLHRKGPIDQARHNERVKEAIKGNLGQVVGEESLITSDGKKIVKVPIRSLEEYKFRFGEPPEGGQVGQGEGDTKVGDVIGRVGQGQAGQQPALQPARQLGLGLGLDQGLLALAPVGDVLADPQHPRRPPLVVAGDVAPA